MTTTMQTPTVASVVFQNIGLVGVSVGLLAIVAFYYYLLPRPIKGIPHNASAASSLFGDIPSMMKEYDGNVCAWMGQQAQKLSSPVCQLFIVPFGKPMVYVSDFTEAQDILMRRKEFDRSDWSIEMLGGAIDNHHINLKTGPVWKAHRRLLQDLMTPKFLHNVVGENIYGSACRLIALWQTKARIADGQPFAANKDIYYTALDAVLDFTFGDNYADRALPPQAFTVGEMKTKEMKSDNSEEPFDFPTGRIDDAITAILQSSEAIGEVSSQPFISLAWALKKLQPKERRFRAIRREFLRNQASKSTQRLHQTNANDHDEEWIGSATDLIMKREQIFAGKDGREPAFWSDTIHDELLGFVIAGHDTTSTTLCWAVKFMGDNQTSQGLLREALQTAHGAALQEQRFPTYQEILKANIPYLDAVIEEILRLGHTIPLLERQCTEDTIILGHPVPKGTTVIMPCLGPSLTEPAFDIPESKRSEGSLKALKEKGKRTWDEGTMNDFRPERWLVEGQDGERTFDSTAGPILTFGLGLRGCFGRKLAYLELKLLMTLIVWNFELLPCPEKLSGYKGIEGLTRSPQDCYVRLRMI